MVGCSRKRIAGLKRSRGRQESGGRLGSYGYCGSENFAGWLPGSLMITHFVPDAA